MNKDTIYSENKSWSEARERERERERAAAVCPAPGVPLTNQHNSPRINYHQRKGAENTEVLYGIWNKQSHTQTHKNIKTSELYKCLRVCLHYLYKR